MKGSVSRRLASRFTVELLLAELLKWGVLLSIGCHIPQSPHIFIAGMVVVFLSVCYQTIVLVEFKDARHADRS